MSHGKKPVVFDETDSKLKAYNSMKYGADKYEEVASSPGGSSYLVESIVEITDAEIKQLSGSGFEIITAPGANKAINFLWAIAYFQDPGSPAYTNFSANAHLEVWDSDFDIQLSGIYPMTSGSFRTDAIMIIPPLQLLSSVSGFTSYIGGNTFVRTGSNSIVNKAAMLQLVNSGGELQDGDAANVLVVKSYYQIIDFS